MTRSLLLAALLLAPAVPLRSQDEDRVQHFGDVALPTLAGPSLKLRQCPKQACVTIVVAPWCGYCRASKPMFLELRKELRRRGVETRFIVGLARGASVRANAKEYGPETMLDETQQISVRGVPFLMLSDRKGFITRVQAGAPPSLEDALAWVGAPEPKKR
jgi:thiol-disulfide isomerase/thioredoxin